MQQVVDIGPDGDWEQTHLVARAELDTAAALERLGAGWHVLHALPVGPGPATLAHLVIGPAGIFAVSSMPRRPTVVDVVDGRTTLSPQGGDEALAEVRQLAQRVLAGLRHRLGRAVDIPAVHPLLCLTDGDGLSGCGPQPHTEVIGLDRLVAHVQEQPRRLTAAWVQRVTALAQEPLTWDAPGAEWFPTDLRARYEEIVGSGGHDRSAAGPRLPDRVVQGQVTASQPPQLPAASGALRTASVLMVVLGMASLGTFGLLSAPSLAFGGLTLRHHGGLKWLNDKDAGLFLVGMVMAVLPVPFWVVLSPVLLGSVV